MADDFPGGDAEFNARLDNFVVCAGANLGLVQGDIAPIVCAHGDARWVTRVP